MLKQVRALQSAKARGQSMVEYALILALVALALAAIFVVTGSAVGNVFSNTVYNLVGQDPNAVVQLTKYGGPNAFWQTVTWVAEHPYQVTLAATLVKNPSATATDGPSPTPSDTPVIGSPSPTATFTPSPTMVDASYSLPFTDIVNNTDSLKKWRLDNSVYLGGGAWLGKYYANQTFTNNSGTGLPDYTLWNYQIDPAYTFNIDFDWGTDKYPIQTASLNWPANRAGGFSIIYTRDIYLAQAADLRFTAAAAGSVVVKLDGTTIIDRSAPASLDTPITPYEQTVDAGPHTLEIDYIQFGGDASEAGVKLDISPQGGSAGAVNPDDTVSGAGDSKCQWGPLNSTNSASLEWMFDDDTTSTDGVGANLTCNLELRGRINLATASNPVLTFWDVWDFTGSSAEAKLQVAEYEPVGGPTLALDRPGLSWVDVPLHDPGEANYNWTRQVVNLKTLNSGAFAGKQITLRFVITNPSGTTGTRRWYIDDIRVAQQTDPGTVTVGQFWDLNSASQKDDFIYDARWDLTSNHTYGAGTAWDDSPGYSPEVFSEGEPRVHYIELKSPVTLVGAPANDNENDTGEAELSFWSMYNINTDTRIQVEWTTAPRDHVNGNEDTWTVLGGSPIADSSGGPLTSGSTMTFYQFPLGVETGVPQDQPFRLRFAMYLDTTSSMASTTGGWWIDNIYLERASPPAYAPYPFNDNAEDSTYLASYWLTPGSWGRAGGQGRNSTFAYADSPSGNYQPNVNNPIQMSKYLDLNNDTAGHSPKYGTTPVKPTLSFWHWRNLASGTTLYVDMYLTRPGETGGIWYPIWSYVAGQTYTPISADNQQAWEREQIDLIQAYETASSVAWTTVTGNAQDNDDDIRLAFRVQSTGSQVADGVFLDDISISDYSEDEFHLWDEATSVSGISGDGTTYTEDTEGAWYNRWYYGGEWSTTTSKVRSGLNSLTDSPSGSYRSNELSIMELKKIIDLRGVVAANQPVAYAWMLRKIDDSDSFSWQISQRDGSTTQGYDKVMGWSAWTPVLSTGDIANDNELWHRVQINLLPYIGQEIKLRLVFNTTQVASSVADGVYLDDLRFTFIQNQRLFPLPFFDAAQSTYNWVTEGQWGLAPDRYKGTGGGTAPLGSNPWTATFVSCDIVDPTLLCNDNLTNFNTVETAAADPTGTAATYPTSVLTGTISEPMVLSYNSTIRPFSATDAKWSTQWVARMTRVVTVEAPATFDFTMLANDGIHARIDGPSGAPTDQQINPSDSWNLANDWNKNDTLAQADRTMFLDAGTYTITVGWLQNSGDAFLSFSVTDSNYAFTDSPNTPDGSGGYDVVKSPSNSDTSLLLDGALNLKSVKNPILQYYTEYDIGTPAVSTSTLAKVEVSNDGGFTWTQDHLSDAFGPTTMDDPTIVGGSQLTSWQFRKHNLTAYAGLNSDGSTHTGYGYLNLRFRLTTKSEPDAQATFGWHDGWYVTEITVNE